MSFKTAAETLMDRVVKKFELKDIIAHRFVPHKNLYEICSQYPSKGRYRLICGLFIGIGFKVWRKTWPKDSYYTIKEVSFKVLLKSSIFQFIFLLILDFL
jgi:small subunit ribosomal protein S34